MNNKYFSRTFKYAACTQPSVDCVANPSLNGYPSIDQSITMTAGATYNISLWARALSIFEPITETDPAAGCSIYAYVNIDLFYAVPIMSFYAPQTEWARFETTFTIPTRAKGTTFWDFSI
jgi:hypothetical protein